VRKQLKADIFLLSVALAWGSTFVLTKNALQHIPAYNFLSIRFVVSTFVLGIIFRKRLAKIGKAAFIGGVLIGLFLFTGYAFQTVGMNYTTASKSGFITGLNTVIVPVLSAIILRKKPEFMAVMGVILAIIGLGFLSLDSSLLPNIGDLYTLFSAFAFAMQVILIDKFTKDFDPICLAVVQIGVVGILSTVFTFWLEQPTIPARTEIGVWMALLLTSLFATIYALVIQNVMQKYTSPTHAALIFMGEPVFSALFAYIMLGELLTLKQIIGCIMMLAGMVLPEIKPANKKAASPQTMTH